MGVALYDPKNPRRTYRGEEVWFTLLEEAGAYRLRRAFIQSGVSATTAGNLVFFLEEQVRLDRHFAEKSRSNYRGALGKLDVAHVRDLAFRPIPGQFNSEAA